MFKIETTSDFFSLDVKKFYFPVKIITICSKCKQEIIRDFKVDFLQYPVLNEPISVNFYCKECGKKIEAKVKLSLNLEEVKL
jgi:hypothetical protein